MGLPIGTGLHSLPTPSPNMSGIGVSDALMHVVTTTSVSSTPLVDLILPPVESPSKPQYPPPQPLLYGVYPMPSTFSLPLSGYMPHSGFGILAAVICSCVIHLK